MSIFLSDRIFKRITDITPEILGSLDIKALLIDVDNTMSTHHGSVLVDGLETWLECMKSNGIKMIIVSNAKRVRAEPFAAKVGLPFVSLSCKPLPFGYCRARKVLGIPKKNCAIVGDQVFTDVLGANLYGIKSLLVRPVKLEDGWSFRIRRYFERKILKDKF